jgi:4-diphosphocytidyl-2-C-methyl-D-erythritol kinase
MTVTVRSFAKINLGLYIGPSRPDGFHELRTVYQTIAPHDVIRVSVQRGVGIEIRCEDPRVPQDASNTCWKIAERAASALKLRGRIVVEIEKRLPVQGGLGGASGNAVAVLRALEIAAKKEVESAEKLRIAAEVGSDLPLFLIGGTVLGVGRGEEVYPLPDLPAMPCVIVAPDIGVSTPKAFSDWDDKVASQAHDSGVANSDPSRGSPRSFAAQKRLAQDDKYDGDGKNIAELTPAAGSDRINRFGHALGAWLAISSGVPARGRGRAGNPLLDLVRTGIENDFERVVFPQNPELREVKSVLQKAGARYASLSGSGSALFGIFSSSGSARTAAARFRKLGFPAQATSTLTRLQYGKKFLVSSR